MPYNRRLLSRVGPSRLALCRSRRTTHGGGHMKSVRLHQYKETPKIEDVDEPKITGSLDVFVRIGGADLCPADLHINEGQKADKFGARLSHPLVHETLGLVEQ